MPRLLPLIAALAFSACAGAPAPRPAAALVLTGTITRADHQTYHEIPFTVPPGTQRIAIDFAYDKENRTVIDLGVRDPDGQRGWSGGNKSSFEIGAWDATPSYKPGAIMPGEWKLILGVPNIREGVTAAYTASIAFDSARVTPPHGTPPTWSAGTALSATPGWRRGDFHAHTAHSDGACTVGDAREPCPAIKTFDAARNAGLDFVAITDHNTITQLADIAGFQSLYPQTLIIPGTEITTFNGHANVIGNTTFLDFQLGSPRLPTLAKLFGQVDAANAFISVNHPSLPSGEACMGCGWTVKDTDWSRVTAIEVINGASMRTSGPEGAFNGIAFWEKLLRDGHRVTAIAGSDNHDATDTTGAKQSPVGTPATVVHASTLSTAAIIAGVKSGRVFIDAAGLPGATLDMVARAGTREAFMGDLLTLQSGEDASLYVDPMNLPDGARFEPISHNVTAIADDMPFALPPSFRIALAPGAETGWIRMNVRDAAGKLILLGNPIYLRRAG